MQEVCTIGNRYAAFVAIRRVIKEYVSKEILSELDRMFLNDEITLGEYIDGAIATIEDEEDIEVLESLYEVYRDLLSMRGCDIGKIRGNVDEVKRILFRIEGKDDREDVEQL